MSILIIILGLAIFYGVMQWILAWPIRRKAKRTRAEAQRVYDYANLQMESARRNAAARLVSLGSLKMRVLAQELKSFAQTYSKTRRYRLRVRAATDRLPTIRPNKRRLLHISRQSPSVVPGSVGTGAFTAYAAYHVPQLIGRASTGTFIARLNGIARRNATLAWLGGGTLKSGGAGMIGGTFTLGGLALGSAIIAGSFSSKENAQMDLAASKTYLRKANQAALRMDKVTYTLTLIAKLASKAETAVTNLLPPATTAFGAFDQLVEKKRQELPPWRFVLERWFGKWLGLTRVRLDDLGEDELPIIYRAIEIGEVLRKIVDTPVLTWTNKINPAFWDAVKMAERVSVGLGNPPPLRC